MFPLVEGQTLLGAGGRYRFLSRLASGTFAVILKAWDAVAGRAVAIKCTHEAALNAIGEREAALLRALNARDARGHVAVVRLLDCFTQRRHFCLVLELLGDAVVPFAAPQSAHAQPWRQARPPPFLLNDRTGEPQHKLLALVYQRRHARHDAEQEEREEEEEEEDEEDQEEEDETVHVPLELDTIRQMAVHLCAALAFVHDQGLIHADLKPENVVHVSETPSSSPSSSMGLQATVKLVDFGNCIERRQLALYEAEDAADESGGFDIQTLAYRAPEVAMGVAIVPPMDMWSLGCLLVECATGKPLFGETHMSADGASQHHSLGSAVELVEQIEWLLTGGVPLGKARPQLYANARHYKYRAERAARERLSLSSRRSPLGRTLARYLPLRHRLEAHRSESTTRAEWADFQDFVERLLDLDPSTRLTARGAFVHPFLQKVFPFQLVFAPELSAQNSKEPRGEIDTTPSSDEESSDNRKEKGDKKKRRAQGDDDMEAVDQTNKKKKKRHVSGSLKHALQLIPKEPLPTTVKKEPR